MSTDTTTTEATPTPAAISKRETLLAMTGRQTGEPFTFNGVKLLPVELTEAEAAEIEIANRERPQIVQRLFVVYGIRTGASLNPVFKADDIDALGELPRHVVSHWADKVLEVNKRAREEFASLMGKPAAG